MSSNMQASRWSPISSSQASSTNVRVDQLQSVTVPPRPTLLLAVNESDAASYGLSTFNRVVAHTTAAVVQQVARSQPALLVVDLDAPGIDGVEICRSYAGNGGPCVLVITSHVDRVPAVLKAGCHAVLLKPFAPNLLSARVGRLLRDRGQHPRMRSVRNVGDSSPNGGTNRQWDSTECPHCRTAGAVSFEYSSHRRMWYACLACDTVWLGPRQE